MKLLENNDKPFEVNRLVFEKNNLVQIPSSYCQRKQRIEIISHIDKVN